MQDYSAQATAQEDPTPLAFAYLDGGSSYRHARVGGEDRMAMLLQEFLPMVESRFGVGTGDPFYANDRRFIDAFPASGRPKTMFRTGCHAADYGGS